MAAACILPAPLRMLHLAQLSAAGSQPALLQRPARAAANRAAVNHPAEDPTWAEFQAGAKGACYPNDCTAADIKYCTRCYYDYHSWATRVFSTTTFRRCGALVEAGGHQARRLLPAGGAAL